MKPQEIAARAYILHIANFSHSLDQDDERNAWFTSKSSAEIVAALPKGDLGQPGRSYSKVFLVGEEPKFYESAAEWAKEKMSYDDCTKFIQKLSNNDSTTETRQRNTSAARS